MSKPFKLWVAAAATYGILVFALFTVFGSFSVLSLGSAIWLFMTLWAPPTLFVLAVGVMFRWAVR